MGMGRRGEGWDGYGDKMSTTIVVLSWDGLTDLLVDCCSLLGVGLGPSSCAFCLFILDMIMSILYLILHYIISCLVVCYLYWV